MIDNIKLTNLDTGGMIEIDKRTTEAYVLDVIDWGTVDSVHHSYKYVNQIGVQVTNSILGTRELELTGWVIAFNDQEMTQRKRMLNRFFNPQQYIRLQYQNYMINFLPHTSIRYGLTEEDNNEVISKFKITGFCPDPLFKDFVETFFDSSYVEPMFHFPLIINEEDQTPPQVVFGELIKSSILEIFNNGDVSTGMRIVFNFTNTVTNPIITNLNTQEYIKINRTFVVGETLVIDTNTGNKSVRIFKDGESINGFAFRDLSSSWLQLEVGENVLIYNSDDGDASMDVEIFFNSSYLEVQQCN